MGVGASGLELLSSTGSWKQQFRAEIWSVYVGGGKSGLAPSKCRGIAQGLAL